jgi:hypothetical protein
MEQAQAEVPVFEKSPPSVAEKSSFKPHDLAWIRAGIEETTGELEQLGNSIEVIS